MTRKDHLAWCKKRAHEYLGRGDLANAIASMLSDLQKHPETQLPTGHPLGMIGIMSAVNGDAHGVRRFIDGFN